MRTCSFFTLFHDELKCWMKFVHTRTLWKEPAGCPPLLRNSYCHSSHTLRFLFLYTREVATFQLFFKEKAIYLLQTTLWTPLPTVLGFCSNLLQFKKSTLEVARNSVAGARYVVGMKFPLNFSQSSPECLCFHTEFWWSLDTEAKTVDYNSLFHSLSSAITEPNNVFLLLGFLWLRMHQVSLQNSLDLLLLYSWFLEAVSLAVKSRSTLLQRLEKS